MSRELQGGCYTLNRNSKIVHSYVCYMLPWANTEGVCVPTDRQHVLAFPKARPCKVCMSAFNVRVMGMEGRIGAPRRMIPSVQSAGLPQRHAAG